MDLFNIDLTKIYRLKTSIYAHATGCLVTIWLDTNRAFPIRIKAIDCPGCLPGIDNPKECDGIKREDFPKYLEVASTNTRSRFTRIITK